MTKTIRCLAALTLTLAFCGACHGPWYDHRFAPLPQEARVVDEQVEGSQARTLVSVLGIRRPKSGDPARVETRLRLENLGSVPATLLPKGIELVTADLQSFSLEAAQLDGDTTVAPGDWLVFDARFDLPENSKPSAFNFDGLVFKWDIDFGAGAVTTSMSFQRVWSYYYEDPYLRSSFGVGYYYVR